MSVRSQTYEPIELVVIDNHSVDSTPDIAKTLADIIETWGPERSAQRNRGARVSHGTFLFFVDSDMTLTAEVISDCVDALGDSERPAVIVPEFSVGAGFWAHCRALERSCYAGDDTIEAARFFRRAAFESIGGFDESLTGPEDWDLSMRIAAGTHLPRTHSQISHDEGTLQLMDALAKKRYYAKSSLRYWRKHHRTATRQASLLVRPAFLRNWRRLLSHPVLTAGIVLLKVLESGAIVWGLLETAGRQADMEGAARRSQ